MSDLTYEMLMKIVGERTNIEYFKKRQRQKQGPSTVTPLQNLFVNSKTRSYTINNTVARIMATQNKITSTNLFVNDAHYHHICADKSKSATCSQGYGW